jgi:PAS domain S-box-containing protein/putative nucleotidyltransferase with HDIG domain
MSKGKSNLKVSGKQKVGIRHGHLLDSLLEGCQVIGFDWRYAYLNDAAAAHGRRAKSDLLGRTMMECYPGIENTRMFALLRNCMEKRTSASIENDFIFPDGAKGWFELRIEPVPEGIMILSMDITERKEARGALLESERRFRLVTENVTDVIWTVDMNMRPTYISPSIFRLLDYTTEEAMSTKMEDIFSPASFKSAMKVLAEEFEKEKRKDRDLTRSRMMELELRRKDGSMVPVEVNFSFIRDAEARPIEILAVARDVSRRRQVQEKERRSAINLLQAMEKTIQAMATIVEMRDPYTAGHQRRVTQLACAIAQEMGLSNDQINALRLAGLVHDVGKVRVPAEILTHPDGLTEAEFSMIKTHPLAGYEILKKMDLPWPIAQIVYQHHERMNGSGYPQGLSGDKIILEARILAVADVVEAMASHRPYRPAIGLGLALDEISQKSGVLYDPAVVDACTRLFYEREFKLE